MFKKMFTWLDKLLLDLGMQIVSDLFGFSYRYCVNYLPPVGEGCGQDSGDYKTPSVCASVCMTFVALLHNNISINISFIYKDIITKFAGNAYGYENLSAKFWPHFEKQNGCHSQLFENH